MQQTENKRAGRPKGSQNKTVRLKPEDFDKLTTALLELNEVPDRLLKLEALLLQNANDRATDHPTKSAINNN